MYKRLLVLLAFVGALALVARAPAHSTIRTRDPEQTDQAETGAIPRTLSEAAHKLRGDVTDYDPLMALVGDAQFVLLGESTHGTHEFYHERARITQRLITEKGFTAVAIEGSWPDAERVNDYIQGRRGNISAEQALAHFTEFPEWMWSNTDVRDLVQWLRAHNSGLPSHTSQVGFYGIDLYSVLQSADAVVQALALVDPIAALRAHERYQCFAPYDDIQEYGQAVWGEPTVSCQNVATEQFDELSTLVMTSTLRRESLRDEALFTALQHARVVQNGEAYFRILYTGEESTWNIRDEHMADTLDMLATAGNTQNRPTKVVVWAHNSHVGDARATELGKSGQWNIGQLTRERHPYNVVLIGFTTYSGTVTAAIEWNQPAQQWDVRPALPDSYAGLFHESGLGNFLLPLRSRETLAEILDEPRLQRAIGVVYRPETERLSHYFEARLSEQFDAVIHWDKTSAVEPLQP